LAAHFFGKENKHFHQGLFDPVLMDIADQRHIDFHKLRANLRDGLQARIAGSKIVDGNQKTLIAQVIEFTVQWFIIFHILSFRNLKDDVVRRHAELSKAIRQLPYIILTVLNDMGVNVQEKFLIESQMSHLRNGQLMTYCLQFN